MIFLIEYDRSKGRIVSMRTFGDVRVASDARLILELDLRRRGEDHEVVLLDAEDEQALRRTHGRYFESLSEILRRDLENGK
jgi:hypothetical protein